MFTECAVRYKSSFRIDFDNASLSVATASAATASVATSGRVGPGRAAWPASGTLA